MPRTSIPSPRDATELVARGIVEYGVHVREGGRAQPTIGKLLDAVCQALDHEAALMGRWRGAEELAPARFESGDRQCAQLGDLPERSATHVSLLSPSDEGSRHEWLEVRRTSSPLLSTSARPSRSRRKPEARMAATSARRAAGVIVSGSGRRSMGALLRAVTYGKDLRNVGVPVPR